MNHRIVILIAIGILFCNTVNAQTTILEIAGNESIMLDSEPELMGNYYVDNVWYYVVKHNNPIAGGISIYDEYGTRIDDASIADKVIVTYRVKFDNETKDVLKNYTRVVSSIDSQAAQTIQSLDSLIFKLDEKETDVSYDRVKTFLSAMNLLKNSTRDASSSCSNALSKSDLLETNKDYNTASAVLDEYEKCVSLIDPINPNIAILKDQIEPASETLNSREVLKLALGSDNLSRDISRWLDDSIRNVDNLKNSTDIEEPTKMDAGILKSSLDGIKSGIEEETAGFETRLDPQSRILKIIAFAVIIIAVIAALVVLKRRGTGLGGLKMEKKKKEEDTGFGNLTVVVTESKTRDPVGNATVTLVNMKTGNKYESRTESNGNLNLQGIVAGSYEMISVSDNHETEKMEIFIDPGVNRSMIVLKRK